MCHLFLRIRNTLISTIFFLFTATHAFALNLSQIDLSTLTFSVDDNFASAPGQVSGTSNGVGYTFEGTDPSGSSLFLPFSNNTSSQYYNDLGASFDDLHVGRDFSITFDSEISYLLVALANDNNTFDGIDFGIAPTDYTGVNVSGSFASIADISGALLLIAFDNPVTRIFHENSNGIDDGFDMSFFAIEAALAEVPLPPTLPLMMTGLIGLAMLRKGRIASLKTWKVKKK